MWAVVRLKDVVVEFILDRAACMGCRVQVGFRRLRARRMWAVVRLKDVVVEFILDRAACMGCRVQEGFRRLRARRMWAVVRLKDVVVEFILDRAASGDANPEERPMDNLLLPLSALATWAACAVRPPTLVRCTRKSMLLKVLGLDNLPAAGCPKPNPKSSMYNPKVIFQSALLQAGVLVLLKVLGLDIRPLLAAGGLGGIVLGLATQSLLANALAGLHLVGPPAHCLI